MKESEIKRKFANLLEHFDSSSSHKFGFLNMFCLVIFIEFILLQLFLLVITSTSANEGWEMFHMKYSLGL